jgi:hypothetical protein
VRLELTRLTLRSAGSRERLRTMGATERPRRRATGYVTLHLLVYLRIDSYDVNHIELALSM